MSEHCDKCGEEYYNKHGVYRLPNDLWEIVYFGVTGKEASGGGLLCMDCINKEFAPLIYWEGNQVDFPTIELERDVASLRARLSRYEAALKEIVPVFDFFHSGEAGDAYDWDDVEIAIRDIVSRALQDE